MKTQKVTFKNELGLEMVGLLRLPENLETEQKYPAIVVTGPMLSIKEQAQSVYAEELAKAGYVTLVFDGSYFGESAGAPRQLELPNVKQIDIEAAVSFLETLAFVDKERIGGLGMCGSGSYMSVAGVKDSRLKAIGAIVPAISNFATSGMVNTFLPEEQVKEAKEKYEKGEGEPIYLNLMPRVFEDGAAYYFTARGNKPRWSNEAVAWSQFELINYNVTEIMKDMTKPYLVITGENAWSKIASQEVFEAVPTDNKKYVEIPEAGHFDLYDLYPYVDKVVANLVPFFAKNL